MAVRKKIHPKGSYIRKKPQVIELRAVHPFRAPAGQKAKAWTWFMPDGSTKEGHVPVPGENCEKIPDEIIYPKNEYRYCTNPACPSAQGQNEVMGQETVWVAGTPAILQQEKVRGNDGTYALAYFCPVCRTYQ